MVLQKQVWALMTQQMARVEFWKLSVGDFFLPCWTIYVLIKVLNVSKRKNVNIKILQADPNTFIIVNT